ncbi:hypothetical protein JXO59_16805 [candidate division KSB1 bacterium]|nr:hypothetical protein [candidate division KSB1 bacterium]
MKPLHALLFILFVFSTLLKAQSLSVVKMEELPIPEQGYYPQFSPDDQKIYYSTSNYMGLWEYDLISKSNRLLTRDPGAGYQFQISPDGRRIVYRCDNFDQPKKRSSIMALDLNDGSRQTIQALEVEVSPPNITVDGALFYTLQNNVRVLSLTPAALTKTPILNDPVVKIENQKMALYIGNEKTLLDPVPDGSYFWQSVSPDKEKILFTEARKGTLISDLHGNILLELGKANYPHWSPDGAWICFMDDYDNGQYFTASDIYIASAQGGKKMALTSTADVIEMYPRWGNTTSNKIIFHTDDGKIVMAEFRIEE